MELSAVFLVGCVLIYALAKRLLKYHPRKETYLGRIIIAWVIVFLGSLWLIAHYGNDEMGSILERNKYRASYFINLYSDDKPAIKYRVKADIVAELVEDSDYDDYNGSASSGYRRAYYLERAYLPDGQIVTFSDALEDLNSDLIVNSEEGIFDDKGRYWRAELTRDRIGGQ